MSTMWAEKANSRAADIQVCLVEPVTAFTTPAIGESGGKVSNRASAQVMGIPSLELSPQPCDRASDNPLVNQAWSSPSKVFIAL